MKVEKRHVIQFLEEQGRYNATREAEVELPAEIDVDDSSHRVLLRELAIEPDELRGFIARVDPR